MKKLIFSILVILFPIIVASTALSESAKEAMKALKKIEARVETGISYRDYSPVLADAKVEVDAYLKSKASKKSPGLAGHIQKAMEYYLLAGEIWHVKFARGQPSDVIWISLPEAAIIKKLYPKARAERAKSIQTEPAYYIPEILNEIWSDASKEIKKAENYME